MKAISFPGLRGLLTAQSQVAFNDNATKLVLIGVVQMLLPPDEAARWVGLIALLLVAPFVLFAPLTGWLADRFPKRDVLAWSLWLQLGIMAALAAAFSFQALAVAVAGFFFLGTQSALMAPARRGMVKDLAENRVGEAVGWLEMLCIVAILVGSLAGGQLIDGLAAATGSPWSAALASAIILGLGCIGALVAFRRVPRAPAAGGERFSAGVLFGHVGLFKRLRRDRGIWRAVWGDAAFYLVGGFLMLMLSQVGRELHPDGPGAARATGIMMAVLGGGIALGSLVAARLSRREIALGLVPAGALGMAAVLAGAVFVPFGSPWFLAVLGGAGFFGGWYLVPLGAFLVARSRDEERGQILAGSGMLSSLAGVAAVGLHALAMQWGGVDPRGQFLIAASFLLLVACFSLRWLTAPVLRLAALGLARIRYRVLAVGAANVPSAGGVLLVCNHVSYVDTLVLSIASPRPIRFLSYKGFFDSPVLGRLLRIFGAIPVSATHAREAIRAASDHLTAGEVVCIFPEGQLTRTGTLLELKSGFELIARRAKAPVVVAQLDGLWGSIHSFAGGRYFTKWPRGLVRRVTVSFSRPLAADEATAGVVRETMLDLGATALAERSADDCLPSALVRALKCRAFQTVVHDPSSGRGPLGGLVVLGLALALGRRWRAIPEDRVGVILPPGLGGTLASLGLIFAGKTVVHLNPLVSAATAREILTDSGVHSVVTATPAVRRLPGFPWPANVLFIDRELKQMRWKGFWIAAAGVIPAGILRAFLRRPAAEAARLFTSGSSGRPKAVALTSSNILGNIRQIQETDFLRADDSLLSPLPLFHSFGLTVGLFLPLLSGRKLVTAPSPLDADAITAAGRAGSPTVLLATPTFLRGYLKRVPRDAFGTLRVVLTGAEPLPEKLAAEARERFGCEVLEGYGLTECSPCLAVNMPHPACGRAAHSMQSGWRAGSVGRLLPGIAARFLDPETHLPRRGADRGVLAVRGTNVITAYAGATEGGKFADGWFVTGDVVRIDAEGFLFIEGRVSRFSKIGGEMVPHGTVEAAIREAFPEGEHCVTARPHDGKGEELVVLTTADLPWAGIRAALQDRLPNLWIPKIFVPVDTLPVLGSGKVDLAECRRLANVVAA